MAPKKSAAKKKKAAAGAQRGFATVSVPSKKVEAAPEAEEQVTETIVTDDASTDTRPNVSAPAEWSPAEWSPEEQEREDLQKLVQLVRPAADKEVSRLGKIYDFDRRMAASNQFYSWQETDLQRRVLESARQENDDQPIWSTSIDDESKALIQLAIVEGVLIYLGFQPSVVRNALSSISQIDIETALDWLFLHCPPEELYCVGAAAQRSTNGNTDSTQTTASGASSPLRSAQDSPAPDPPRRASSAPVQPAPCSEEADEAGQVLKAEILSLVETVLPGTDETAQDANYRYATLKLQQSELQRTTNQRTKRKLPVSTTLEAFASAVEKDLVALTSDYTFRKSDAEHIFREKRIELDKKQLEDKLNGIKLQRDAALDHPREPKRPATQPTSPSKGETSDDASEGGDLFGDLLDEPATQTTTETGVVLRVEDYGLPKHFSGRTPKRALEEFVRKIDRSAIVMFSALSRTRACRARVDVRWKNGDRKYVMEDLATRDQASAENYIATVALFDLADSQIQKTLPPIFRDLWSELAAQKAEVDDLSYREKIKGWRALLAERASKAVPKPTQNRSKTSVQVDTTIAPGSVDKATLEQSRQLSLEFRDRQQWKSYQDMLQQRAQLPIAAYRDRIIETLEYNQCLVLCGETGCGKSTQVPSFILEHGLVQDKHTKIYCTEPRRISAISLAQRVSAELGEARGACGGKNSLVGYSIRLDANVSASTRIVYATTGIVLRMLEGSDSFADITHLIIDEVHERSIDSDFLLIVLRQLLKVRHDLKVILMSATVDAEKIATYMGGCPVITVPGRTFPVSAYFLEDVLQLTGYHLDAKSDSPYVSRARKPGRSRLPVDETPPSDSDDEDEGKRKTILPGAALPRQVQTTLDVMDQHAINFDLITSLLETVCFGNADLVAYSSAILVFLPSLESIRRLNDMLESHPVFGTTSFLILPLHSMLSNENQSLVFEVPPAGVRKIVISTNIAETGVTIPDITCVIDSGKHREMRYDEKRQISRLVETYVAQSNSAQRRGRAGRVQEGVCFHLFTRDRFTNIMAEHPQPEIMRLSLQDLALRIKIMKIGSSSIEDVLSQALDPPLAINIQRAVATLIEAKALTSNEEITPLGRHLAKLPMDVHLGKFLIMSCLFNCLDAALTIVAALNSKSPWVTPFGREAEADAAKRAYKIENSDFLTLYNAYCAWREACGRGRDQDFCRKNFLSRPNLQQIEELKQQYFGFLVDTGFVGITESAKRELISSRWGNGKNRTRFVKVPDELDEHSNNPSLVMSCLAASLYPKLLQLEGGQLFTLQNRVPAAIHPSSVNFMPSKRVDFEGSRFLTFFTAMRTKKLYVWESGTVDERAIYLFCGSADFELPSQSVAIDRKIRATFEPKTAIMLKVLRERFNALFLTRMRDPSPDNASQKDREWLDFAREAIATDKEKRNQPEEPAREAVKLSLHIHA